MTSSMIALFEQQQIRKTRFQDQWYFCVVDIIPVLTPSIDPSAYWRKLKQRLKNEGNETVTNCHTLKFVAQDGKMRSFDAANTTELLRIIQSIPSPKAELFKLRLAQVGYERIQEINDPELATQRTRELYKAKGYSEDRIEKRMRGIAVREQLTDERSKRGATGHRDYAILTAEISKATFGMTPSEYKKFKNIPDKSQANLRDNMTDLELIFSMLGERATTEITQTNDSQGIVSLKQDAKAGGTIAGDAKKALETKTGKKVVSKENYLIEKEKQKLK